ncbi:MAG: hypothetical protein ICV65_17085, partial [Flavisolibacter sp.]|nr:hypothetical protein [Flavisolibacter sp.]
MDEHFPKIIQQWLGKQRGSNNESIDTPTKEAANICGASQAASDAAKGTEPVSRKERTRYNAAVKPLEESALQVWSRSKGLWISENDFMRQYATLQITDLSGSKLRPAVVLADTSLDLTVCFITAQTCWQEPTDVLLTPSATNGLRKP